MKTLSTGLPSTLGSYLTICNSVFGKESPQSIFIQDKINEALNGAEEEVIIAESQMLYLLVNLK